MQQYLVRQHGDEFGISGAVAEKRVVVAENAAYARLVCTLPRVLDSCAYRTLYAGGSCCESLSDSRVQTLGYAVEQSPVSETFKNSAPDVSVTLEVRGNAHLLYHFSHEYLGVSYVWRECAARDCCYCFGELICVYRLGDEVGGSVGHYLPLNKRILYLRDDNECRCVGDSIAYLVHERDNVGVAESQIADYNVRCL